MSFLFTFEGKGEGEQWLKCYWTQGNAVPALPIIDIQRSRISNFMTMLMSPQPLVEGPKLMYSSLNSDFQL